jgi:hypothetical protein
MNMKAKLIHVVIHAGPQGLITATSPDHKGLRVTAKSIDTLLPEIPKVLEALYNAVGRSVSVYPVEGAKGHELTWVVIPLTQSLDQCA